MFPEQNIATVRRYYEECANDRDPAKQRALMVADEFLTADFAMAYNNQPDAEAHHGRDTHKEFLIGHARAFRGEQWTVEAIIADARLVACQWPIQITHTAAGNPIDLRGADFFTVRNEQLAALRRFLDFRLQMEQTQPTPTQQSASALDSPSDRSTHHLLNTASSFAVLARTLRPAYQ